MTRLVLAADLHFGCEDASVVQELLRAVDAAAPDLVILAGDFVQRARASHYRPAHAFLDRISAPVLSVPGNHDIPLFNLGARLLAPRAAYREWICPETEPTWQGPGVSVIGLDTTDRFSHQNGRIGRTGIARICRRIAEAGDRLPVIVAHHPFHQRLLAKKMLRGGPRALDAWAGCGTHMILSGHLHHFFAEPFVARKAEGRTLQIHCGTSSSTRRRDAPNDFAILDLEGNRVTIRQMVHQPGACFVKGAQYRFVRGESGWALGG